MPFAPIQSDTNVAVAAPPVTATLPANLTVGKILVAFVTSRPDPPGGNPPTFPAGVVYLVGSPDVPFVEMESPPETTNHKIGLYWHVVAAGEEALTTVAFEPSHDTATSQTMTIEVVEFDHDFTNPVLSSAAANATSGGTGVGSLNTGPTGAFESTPVLLVGQGSFRTAADPLLEQDDTMTELTRLVGTGAFQSLGAWEQLAATTSIDYSWSHPFRTSTMIVMVAAIVEGPPLGPDSTGALTAGAAKVAGVGTALPPPAVATGALTAGAAKVAGVGTAGPPPAGPVATGALTAGAARVAGVGTVLPPPLPPPLEPVVLVPPDWSWRVRSPSGAEEELGEPLSRVVTVRLDAPFDATFLVDALADDAALLDKDVTDLLVSRGADELYRGKVIALPPRLDEDTGLLTVQTVDYRGLLDLVARVPAEGASFVGVDQGEIAWQLIDDYQRRPGGDRGITNGLGPVSARAPRDKTYDPGAAIGSAIAALGRLIEGFEWEIDASLALNRWHAPNRRGRDDIGVLDYGGRLARVTGAPVTGFANAWVVPGGEGTSPATAVAPDVGTDLRGRVEASETFTSIVDQDTLDARAAWLLGQSLTPRPDYVLEMAPGEWDGPGDVWLGDRFTLSVAYGVVEIEARMRVVELSIALDDDDNETVRLGVVAEPVEGG